MLNNSDSENLLPNNRVPIEPQIRLGQTPDMTQDEIEDLLDFLQKAYIV